MGLTRYALLLAFVLTTLLAKSLGGKVHRDMRKKVHNATQDAYDLDMSATNEIKNRHLAMARAEIVPFNEDISKPMRMELMDNCKGLGRNCSGSDECCTLVQGVLLLEYDFS